jgi:AraC family transcriptional regulator
MMNKYGKGAYLGVNVSQFKAPQVLVSKTVYSENYSSNWHCHENPYLAFILNGGSIEKRTSGSVSCVPGSCFFYASEEPHQNVNYQYNSVNFNIELEKDFFVLAGLDPEKLNGLFGLDGTCAAFVVLKIIKETRINDMHSSETIKSLLWQLFGSLINKSSEKKKSNWAVRLADLLREDWSSFLSLEQMSSVLDVHPVTISRYFPVYFNCTLGEYIRNIKVKQALALMRSNDSSLTDIALTCGFSDQSHFTRTFKRSTGMLPKEFRLL